MIKGNKIIDLIRGEYTGRWPQRYKRTDNGKKPIIRPSGFNSAQVFDHALDPKKNVKKFETFSGEVVNVLVPSEDIYNFTEFDDSPWAQLTGESSDKIREKNKKIEELKDRIEILESELEKHTDGSIEQQKYNNGSSGSSTDLRCFDCGKINSRSQWENNGGRCPWCEQSRIDNAEVV